MGVGWGERERERERWNELNANKYTHTHVSLSGAAIGRERGGGLYGCTRLAGGGWAERKEAREGH